MKHICRAALVLAAAAVIASCGNKKFNVTGQIENAKDSLLYFEHVGLEGIDVVDSVKLGDSGSFSFSEEAPDAPEFYRLRISDQIINVAIDSTETVTFRSSWPQMASKYEVEGSENCEKIKELTLQLMDLRERAIAISQNDQLSIDEANDSLLAIITQYKNDVKTKYIFPTPGKSYAYFALFQTLGDMLLFNPRNNKDDIKVFAAVATSWDTYYPHAERGQNLHNIAIEGMKNQRIVEAKENQTIEASRVQEAGVLDIELTDNKGQVRHLTDLKGKVVLLDFHVFAMDESPARILTLRELYNKYHAQGFEVFQVSLDSDEHFWKQQTAALPWISVLDPNGIQSQIISMYNIQAVPDFFLIDRDNNLVKRAAQIKDLDTEIKKLL
ncbi:MAG: TlpA disulfide reductase family protein [Prevotella sp.]|jgi:peroxiredoxin|nr:TlpA disulfide reductase family protein [Prevotella sp.]